jgi:hypothetical protein
MIRLLVVRERVPPGRVIGTRHPAACQADKEADPGAPGGFALPAAFWLNRYRPYRVKVFTSRCGPVRTERSTKHGAVSLQCFLGRKRCAGTGLHFGRPVPWHDVAT